MRADAEREHPASWRFLSVCVVRALLLIPLGTRCWLLLPPARYPAATSVLAVAAAVAVFRAVSLLRLLSDRSCLWNAPLEDADIRVYVCLAIPSSILQGSFERGPHIILLFDCLPMHRLSFPALTHSVNGLAAENSNDTHSVNGLAAIQAPLAFALNSVPGNWERGDGRRSTRRPDWSKKGATRTNREV